jgi:hypothetical protein
VAQLLLQLEETKSLKRGRKNGGDVETGERRKRNGFSSRGKEIFPSGSGRKLFVIFFLAFSPGVSARVTAEDDELWVAGRWGTAARVLTVSWRGLGFGSLAGGVLVR